MDVEKNSRTQQVWVMRGETKMDVERQIHGKQGERVKTENASKCTIYKSILDARKVQRRDIRNM